MLFFNDSESILNIETQIGCNRNFWKHRNESVPKTATHKVEGSTTTDKIGARDSTARQQKNLTSLSVKLKTFVISTKNCSHFPSLKHSKNNILLSLCWNFQIH